MFKALCYKEWAKTKRIIWLLAFVFVAFLIYSFINTDQQFRLAGAVEVWSTIAIKDLFILPDWTDKLPVLAGLLLGLAQFVPEMTDKRLKLTLHLPLPEDKILSNMLLYGVMVLLAFYIITYTILFAGLSSYFPREIMTAMLLRSIPWLLAGLVGYLLAAWVCFEPVWKQRVINALVSVATLSFFFFPAHSGAYLPFLPYLVLFTLVSFSFPFYSASRFKEGAL